MRRSRTLLRAARRGCCLLLLAGCSAVEPRAVSPDLAEPVFASGWLLQGSLSLEPGFCSLATVGLDVTVLPAELPPPEHTRPLERGCQDAIAAPSLSSTGSPGEWIRLDGAVAWVDEPVRVEARRTDVLAVLRRVPEPRGIAILFAGLAMPADSDVMRRFADALARRGWLSATVLRDDSISGFDPLWEAHRGLALARELRRVCAPGAPAFAFLGLSMGGIEALLAGRDASGSVGAADIRVAVLDPVLDFRAVASHLDGYFHDVSTDAMQTYFQRIMAGRYRMAPVRFGDILARVPPTGRATRLDQDPPSAWLCDGPVNRYRVFLSRFDPVLGDEQRAALEARGFPFRRSTAAGHIPLACDLSLFDLMVDAATGPPSPDAGGCRPPDR